MIAFIDCYIETPVNHCVNQFTEKSLIPSTYHMVSQFGIESLLNIEEPICYIILGSAAHVSDKYKWQEDLLKFIIPKLNKGIPVLGLCYGHQLLAKYFGSEISYICEDESISKQARTVKLTKGLWSFELNKQFKLGYAHAQVISKLGSNLEELGCSSSFNFEIIKHRTLPFFGTQAHPEASISFLKEDAQIQIEVEEILNDGYEFLLEFYNFSLEKISKN